MSTAQTTTVVYVHGAGNKPPSPELKQAWDADLFGQDMGERTRMAYYADVPHDEPAAEGIDACEPEEALSQLSLPTEAVTSREQALAAAQYANPAADEASLLDGLTPAGQRLFLSLGFDIASRAASQRLALGDTLREILPLPVPLRRLLLRLLLQQLIPDADSYFFTDSRNAIQDRLRAAVDAVDGPVVVVSHSLGTVIAYDVLSEPRFADHAVPLLVTLGSPLGYTEIQDVVTQPLRTPAPVTRWANFADPWDLVTLDTSVADDFDDRQRIVDTTVNNPSPTSHAACGYLRVVEVRSAVTGVVPAAAERSMSSTLPPVLPLL